MIFFWYNTTVFVLILTLFYIIVVGLPGLESREKILRTLLTKERVAEGLDSKELAAMTERYTGSDLKVCFYSFSYELTVLNLMTLTAI